MKWQINVKNFKFVQQNQNFWIQSMKSSKNRGVRRHRQKPRKNSVKLGKNAKNRLKIKEKAEILAQENCQKRGNQLKRGTLTPLWKAQPTTIKLALYSVADFKQASACLYKRLIEKAKPEKAGVHHLLS